MSDRVALFDADGVFLQTAHAGNYFERRYGIAQEQMGGFPEMVNQCLVGKADFRDELARFLESWGIQKTAADVLEEAFSTGAGIDPGVAAAIKSLRSAGVTCGLVTNQDRHRMAYLDRTLAIRSYFDVAFVSCELGMKKPDHDFYRAISSHFLHRRLTFWDDRPENVSAALACGWKAFIFRDSDSLLEDFRSSGV